MMSSVAGAHREPAIRVIQPPWRLDDAGGFRRVAHGLQLLNCWCCEVVLSATRLGAAAKETPGGAGPDAPACRTVEVVDVVFRASERHRP